MSYCRNIYRTPVGMYVEQYHSGRAAPRGEKRRPKKERTKEEIEKNNQRVREKNIQLLLMNNFQKNDYFATLTYRKEKRPPDMKTAKKELAAALRVIRREYRKRDTELKWICNIEKGSRGGWHIHLCLNRIRDTDIILRKAWEQEQGGVHTTLLYEEGGFRMLAGYFSKQAPEDEKTGKRDSGYSRSRNLDLPKPEKKVIRRWDTWKDEIKVPEGYYLDKESVQEGYNRAGYPYRRYVLLATEERRKKDVGSAPVRRGRKHNTKKKAKKNNVRAGTGPARRKSGEDKGEDHGV